MVGGDKTMSGVCAITKAPQRIGHALDLRATISGAVQFERLRFHEI